MNTFQKFFKTEKSKEVVREILLLFHGNPDLKISINYRYDWVCLESKSVSIGIQFDIHLYGEGWKMDAFVNAFNKTGNFRIWRFYDDPLYKKVEDPTQDQINEIMKNVPKPTPKELFDYYYKD